MDRPRRGAGSEVVYPRQAGPVAQATACGSTRPPLEAEHPCDEEATGRSNHYPIAVLLHSHRPGPFGGCPMRVLAGVMGVVVALAATGAAPVPKDARPALYLPTVAGA